MDTITPAYGRDYTTQKAALAGWNADKDFMLNMAVRKLPTNRQDMNRDGEPLLKLRFNKLQKVVIIKRCADSEDWKKA
jgi:hypothetical protein